MSEAKVLVTDVAEGCAASGLVRRGDRLLTINGVKVADEQQGTVLAKAALGNVAYYILRGEELVTVTAHKPQAATRLGVTIKNLTDDQQAQARGAAQRRAGRGRRAHRCAAPHRSPERTSASRRAAAAHALSTSRSVLHTDHLRAAPS